MASVYPAEYYGPLRRHSVGEFRSEGLMRGLTGTWCVLLSLLIAGPLLAAEEHQQVSRLPPLPQPFDPIMQEMFDKRRAMGGAIINLQLTTGHASKFSRAAAAMAFTIRFDAQIAAVASWRGSPLFDEPQRALLGYVEQMAHGGDVDDATFAALARHFKP